MINSDNYVYSNIHCYGMLFHFRTGYSKKILDLVLVLKSAGFFLLRLFEKYCLRECTDYQIIHNE